MIKLFKRKTLAGAFALLMGTIILIAPLTANAANFADYRKVEGDGVRLRKTASDTGVILELMYRDDHVWVDREYTSNYWDHVKREKTSTIGYAPYEYIEHK